MIKLQQVKTVVKFEYLNYVKSKVFIATTLIFMLLLLIAAGAPQIAGLFSRFFNGGDKTPQAAFAVNPSLMQEKLLPDVTPSLLKEYMSDYEWSVIPDTSGFAQYIENESYTVVIYYAGGLTYDFYAPGSNFRAFSAKSGVDALIVDMNRQVRLNAMESNQREQMEALFNLQAEGNLHMVGVDIQAGFWFAYALLFLLYIVTILYGQFILTSVVTEKSSKAMELLITSAEPLNFLFGKVVGVGAAALTQVGLILLTGVITIKMNSAAWWAFAPAIFAVMNSSALSAPILIYFILFFLLGYYMYAFLYAAMGSGVSRMEEASSMSAFPSLLVAGSFIIAITGLTNVNAGYLKVLSFIPLFSPMVMFARICLGVAETWEAVVSLILLAAGVYAAGWVGAKIYRVGVLMYGKPPKVKDFIRMLRE